MFETIVWATDGSESADRALPYAKALAEKAGGKLVVVHAVEHLAGAKAGGEPVHADEDELKAKIKQQAADLSAEGLDVTLDVVGGPTLVGAAHLIADAARGANADTIVVGTRGHTRLAGLLLGSVAQRLVLVAPCPVLAVPADSR